MSGSQESPQTEKEQEKKEDRRRLLIALLFLLLSCSCIFCSSQSALLLVDQGQINASMLSTRQADYGADLLTPIARVNESVITEVAHDEAALLTPRPGDPLSMQTPIASNILPIIVPSPLPVAQLPPVLVPHATPTPASPAGGDRSSPSSTPPTQATASLPDRSQPTVVPPSTSAPPTSLPTSARPTAPPPATDLPPPTSAPPTPIRHPTAGPTSPPAPTPDDDDDDGGRGGDDDDDDDDGGGGGDDGPRRRNHPPIAVDDLATMVEDSLLVINVLINDSDPNGDVITVVGVLPGRHGTVVNNITTVLYTPNLNFSGTDVFTYTISDGQATDTAVVTVTVVSLNDPPIAVDDTATTLQDNPVVINLLANDSDPDGDPLSIIGLNQPAHGALTTNSDGIVTYVPQAGFSGVDSFTYQVCDPSNACDTATVTITVISTEEPPIAGDDLATTTEDTPVVINAPTNDTDPNSNLDLTSVTVTTNPANGAVSVNPTTGEITYTPNLNFNGLDSFTYQICDTAAPPFCDTATVSVTVIPVQDPPVAGDDTAASAEDTSEVINVLTNDSDPDGDPLTVTAVGQPANGTVVINNGINVTYTPNPDFNGTDSFIYQVCDPGGGCDTATVTVNIISVVNSAPSPRRGAAGP